MKAKDFEKMKDKISVFIDGDMSINYIEGFIDALIQNNVITMKQFDYLEFLLWGDE